MNASGSVQHPVQFALTSFLGPEYYEALEDLFFFNPGQTKHRHNIIDSVEKFGSPRLVERLGGLRIEVPKAPDAQTLYVLTCTPPAPSLAGVVVYTRSSPDEFEILHLAINADAQAEGSDNGNVTSFLISELCRIARRVKGVRAIRLPYRGGRIRVEHWCK